ncbi:DUF1697 domain-containing protein [Microbacterium sp. CPCC 204701]|uniref:DUF1697 domain-containing protein n=1 Tax=Microbacterium sp. CPCC 204701 TaxID=2493084 RepID=UPI000FDBF710|nr:DUF1697 domain-containing protein [Microbacterium sp. CPCC 204701]
MRCVALLRNVNQGQRGHPSTADILGAFEDAGCLGAVPFQSNGTVVFEADDPATAAEAVVASIAARAGLERDCFWIPFDDLVSVVDEHGATPDPHRHEFTLHSGGTIDPAHPDVASEAAYRRCELVATGAGWALTRNERDGDGNATPVIERVTGGQATSRGLRTVVRLVDRFATAESRR